MCQNNIYLPVNTISQTWKCAELHISLEKVKMCQKAIFHVSEVEVGWVETNVGEVNAPRKKRQMTNRKKQKGEKWKWTEKMKRSNIWKKSRMVNGKKHGIDKWRNRDIWGKEKVHVDDRSKKDMARTKYNFWIYIPVLSLILSLTHHSSQESWWEFREATLQPVSAKTLFLFLSCWMLFLSLAISIFFYGECHHWCCIVQSFCHTGWHSAKKITFPFICGANAFSFF